GLLVMDFSYAKPLSEARKAKVKPEMGDPELDQRLAMINERGNQDQKMFVEGICRHFGVDSQMVGDLLGKGLSPADVYMSLLLSKTLKQDVQKVLDLYNVNRGKSWGVIAQEMGIKPGSKEFHALKGDNFWAKEQKKGGAKEQSQKKGR
ncbi:MAG: hypothetical protein ACK4WB_08465, partial [Desulfatiglandales bacterium]